MSDTQISAHISADTRDKVDRYTDAHGLKKGALLEQALLHHLQALQELPADLIIPPRLEVSVASMEQISRVLAKRRKPSKAIRALVSGRNRAR